MNTPTRIEPAAEFEGKREGGGVFAYGVVAEQSDESERSPSYHSSNGSGRAVEVQSESEATFGSLPDTFPFSDLPTFVLASNARWWFKSQKMRIGMANPMARIDPVIADAMQSVENRLRARVEKAIKAHPLYDWLVPLKGLRGPTVAYVIGAIRDPYRFPGQRCEAGHHARVRGEVGAPCPIEDSDEIERVGGRCGAPLLAPGRGTGVRALWQYCGLACDDKGRAIRKRKGQQANFDPQIKGLLLAPDGVAGQIVRQRTPGYREIYDATKERLIAERVVEVVPLLEIDCQRGPGGPLRLYQTESIARKVAVKAFIGDLLIEWKRTISL